MPGLSASDLGVNVGHSVGKEAGTRAKSANYSPYMKAILAANHGEVINACPFGCQDEELDEHGRCYHRIGVSPDGEHIEPEVIREDGKVVVRPAYEVRKGKRRPKLELVDKGRHELVRVTTSYLVYENRERPENWAPAGDLLDDEPTDDEPEED